MWYEILPSAGIITALLAVPVYAMWGLNKLTLGNVSKRGLRYIADGTVNLYNCVLDRSASHLFNILIFNLFNKTKLFSTLYESFCLHPVFFLIIWYFLINL